MSTILDALRRVEDKAGTGEPQPALDGDLLGPLPEGGSEGDPGSAFDAASEPDPSSEAERETAPATPTPPQYRAHSQGAYPESISIWPWAMAVAVGVLLIASGSWLLAARQPDASAGSEEVARAASNSTPAASPTAVVPGAPGQALASGESTADPASARALEAESARYAQARMREAIGADAEDVAAEERAVATPQAETVGLARVANPEPPTERRRDSPAPSPVAQATAPAQRPAPSEPPDVGERSLPIAETYPVAEREPVPAKVAEPFASAATIRATATLPPAEVEVLEAPPEIRIARTRWHPVPERRSADIEVEGAPHEVKEGDSIDALRVSEIRPSGVVFVHAGIRLERMMGSR